MQSETFWEYFDRLLAGHPVKIDRPAGSAHPRYPEMIYPLNYGYLQDSRGGDGEGIDVWVGSQPCNQVDGLVISVDLLKADAEVKLLVGCSPAEMEKVVGFLNSGDMQAVLMLRRGGFLETLTSRRSVRRFSSEPLPDGTLDRILEAAVQAPSAHNRQPWRFVVLETPKSRLKLIDAMGAEFRRDLEADGYNEETVHIQINRSRQRINEAPAAVIVCIDTSTVDTYPDASRQRAAYLMMVHSVAMAGQNLLLAAHTLGLGAVWMCAPLFAQQAVRQALDLPAKWEPQGLVLLGKPARKPAPGERSPAKEFTMVVE